MTPVQLKLKDGGPAFPRPYSLELVDNPDRPDQPRNAQVGMSVRDYFAAKALLQSQVDTIRPKDDPLSWEELVAQAAYKLADAMLKERDK